ncbi:WecB/TagA/CpsF family glycosyltransferase [Enterobacter ludwigii]|uniref:WecB/TagA/CpsF family glycosyltransferase n=1 Tax=Enterobacter ludwigii TaxID=299767 RepID=UPI003B9F053C
MYCPELENKIVTFENFHEILCENKDKRIKVSFVNPFSYPIIAKRPDLIENIDYWFSDGSTLCLVTNLFRKREEKISRGSFDFSSLAGPCFEYLQNNFLSVAIIGGTADECERACDYFRKQYPRLNICFHHHGFLDLSNASEVLELLINSKPDALVIGMGTPKQEEFMINAANLLSHCKMFFTCGGFITQTATSGDYYHPLVKKLGLRWLQRAILHKHVRHRLLFDYPMFYYKYLTSGIGAKLKNNTLK